MNSIKFFLFLALVFLIIFCIFIKDLFFTSIGSNLFLKYHKNDQAVFVLEKFTNLGENAEANFLLGRIYFVKGQNRENLFTSIDYFTKAMGIYEKEKKINYPLYEQLFYGRGLAYGFLGGIYLINAEKDFQKYIEIEDKKEKETGKRSYGSWAGYNDLAWIYYLEGNFKKSEEVSKTGLQMSNHNPWLLNMLGISQVELGKCKEAKINLEKALSILETIKAEKWGEAYSGDDFNFYADGKSDMKKSIEENIKICDK